MAPNGAGGGRANERAVSVGAAELRGVALEASPVGVGATEAVRRELSEDEMADIVRAEITERLDAAAKLTTPAHADLAAQLHEEVVVLRRFLDAPSAE